MESAFAWVGIYQALAGNTLIKYNKFDRGQLRASSDSGPVCISVHTPQLCLIIAKHSVYFHALVACQHRHQRGLLAA